MQRAEYADLKVYLPNDVLVKVDRMSMQHGLEVRCPLLDRRLVELAFRLPESLKQASRTGKHLLKQVARRRLPAGYSTIRSMVSPHRLEHGSLVLIASSFAPTCSPQAPCGIASFIDLGWPARWFDAHVAGRA